MLEPGSMNCHPPGRTHFTDRRFECEAGECGHFYCYCYRKNSVTDILFTRLLTLLKIDVVPYSLTTVIKPT